MRTTPCGAPPWSTSSRVPRLQLRRCGTDCCTELVRSWRALRAVFESAGIAVTDLDAHLGGTRSAGAAVRTCRGRTARRGEAASGDASERAYEDPTRHLRMRPTLPGSRPVDGGALLLNHECSEVPQERTPRPYRRPEFLAAQREPVITSLELLEPLVRRGLGRHPPTPLRQHLMLNRRSPKPSIRIRCAGSSSLHLDDRVANRAPSVLTPSDP